MLVVMVLGLAVIGVKLVSLQGSSRAYFDKLSRDQMLRTTTLAADRGRIMDRNGADLAMSVSRPDVFVDPSLIVKPIQTARALSPLLGLPATAIEAKLVTEHSQYELLRRHVTPQVAKAVTRMKNPGLGLHDSKLRVAPNGNLAAPIIGFVNGSGVGGGGIEHKYDGVLAGKPGRLDAERDPSGREIPATERKLVPAVGGRDLVLTIDRDLQYQVEQQLTAEVAAVHAKGGMAAIADVRSGDLLAAAVVDGEAGTTPAHPAGPTEANRLFTTPFEPGSTNKVITIASALEQRVIDENTRFSVPAQTTVGGSVFADDEPHGTANWTVHEILAQSSNVGTIKIAQLLGREQLDRAIRNFGLNVPSAIAFPGESYGLLQSPGQGDPSIMGSLPIGYGVSATAIQTLGVYMTLANGGMTRPLRLVDSTIDEHGVRHRLGTMPARRVVSTQTAAIMNQLMRGVVTSGTGVKAAIPGYTVAGKTGTVRKQPYAEKRYMASFAGFAPAEAPRFAAIVVLDEPQTKIYGGAVSAPVFSQIMQDALRLEHVPPTVAIDSPAAGASRAGAGTVSASAP
ncbi:MAG: peptidoglycan D,D-transpeptidase FtsI family protein [Acidimicrobiia bacterium]